MAIDLLNLDAESGKNIISDDSGVALTLENTGSGEVLSLRGTGGYLLSTYSCPTTAASFKSAATEATPVVIEHAVVGSPTVAPLKIAASGASAPAFQIEGGCIVSITSGASFCAAIRIKRGDQYYWIPLVDEVDGAAAP